MEKKSSFITMPQEQFNHLVAVAIALVTVLVAILTYLQSDASARDDQANRDSKRYSLEAFGKQVSGDSRVNFDQNVAYQALYELETLAISAEARGDDAAAQRYRTMAEGILQFSPMLGSPYYDYANDAAPNVARYEVDTYLTEIVALREKYTAASIVKDTWDKKANTYIVHLTLLAVTLFLFGLSSTISNQRTRWIFAGMGVLVSVAAILWAFAVWASPVFDLRLQGSAIDDYASGVSLAYQEKYDEAIAAFDRAIGAHPGYVNAYLERAGAFSAKEEYEKAAADYEAAQANGDKSANTAGELAWTYYLLGEFEQAVEMNNQALESSPDELWIRFDLALSYLAGGNFDAARDEYQKGMDSAVSQVAAAKEANAEPPSYLWWGLADAAQSLDDLLWTLDQGEGSPPPDSIENVEQVSERALGMMGRLKSLATALEYTGKPHADRVSGEIGAFQFAEPIFDDEGELTGQNESTTDFPEGLKSVLVQFDYSEMQDGQEILFKLYYYGDQDTSWTEDPSWRIQQVWDLGAQGSANILFSYAYSDAFEFDAGDYLVEMYIYNVLVQWGYFTVGASE